MSGRVVLARDSALRPVPGTWVTLHRVGNDASGPLDSVASDVSGAFQFRYRPTGTPDAIYFVSASYAGIAYFAPPLRAAVVEGDDAEIAVFDTTSAAVAIQVRGRHLILSAPENGSRNVIEVFELSNDASVTAVSRPGEGRGTWSVALPRAARDVRVRAGEVAADAVTTTGGRVTLFAPFAPGLKQLAFEYRLDDGSLPLALQAEAPVAVLEVLVEGGQGTASGGRIVPVAPVTLEGRNFRRFLAQDVAAGTTFEISGGEAGGSVAGYGGVAAVVLGSLGALMLGALFLSERRRRGRVATAATPLPTETPPPVSSRGAVERLAREIAALDAAYERLDPSAGGEREAYARDRAALKQRLAEALAAEPAGR